MNAANLEKAARLHKMLAAARYGARRNTPPMETQISVCGTTPFNIDHKACVHVLAALEAHLVAELTALGVTELETH